MQLGEKTEVLEGFVPYELYVKLQQESSQKIMLLEQQLAELKRLIYGAKSERFISENPNQLHLFVQAPSVPEITTEQVSYERKKKAKPENPPVRLPLPAHLLRVAEVIEPTDLPEGAKRIGQEITEILEYNPANIFVRQIIRPKYAVNQGVVTADLPSLPLPKSNAGASMLAFIAVSKFIDHLPFYRLSQIFVYSGDIDPLFREVDPTRQICLAGRTMA